MMPTGNSPIVVLKEGTDRRTGRTAQFNNIAAAKAIGDAVRSTLGPKGMDKMLVDGMGDVIISNDGVTILKEIDVEHPAAKMMVEVAKTQEEECGDGTTTAVVVAGELLKWAEDLLEMGVHPTMITQGYEMAAKEGLRVLRKNGIDIGDDVGTLIKIAETAMTGKSASGSKSLLAKIAVNAILPVSDKDDIKIVCKPGGSISDTQLIEGIVLDNERVNTSMPKEVELGDVALINCALEVKKTEVDARINITDPSQLQQFLDEEERMIRDMVDKVVGSGADIVFCQKGIDDLAHHYLAKDGLFAIRRVKKSDMEMLAKATGATIVNNLDDLTREALARDISVVEKKIADDNMTFITGCSEAKAVTILVRGSTEHVVDEVERALDDAIGVLSVCVEDGKAVSGGGSIEIELSLRLREYASTVGGREQLAIEAFANAMEVIPRTLAENAGLDAINAIVDMKSAHEGESCNKHAGLDVMTGKVVDMREGSVIEPLRVKTQAVESATEAATMILRIDDVIASKAAPDMPNPEMM